MAQTASSSGGLWAAYVHALQTSPLWTKALTSFVLNGLEEYIAQQLSARAPPPKPTPLAATSTPGKAAANAPASSSLSKASTFTIKKGVDYERVIKMALYGLLIGGPLGHYLYRFIDRLFAGQKGAAAAIAQLVAVNVIAIPIQNYVYFDAMASFANKKGREASAYIAENVWAANKMTWLISPPIQIFALRFLPPAFWTPFFNLVGFIFGVYFNVLSNRPKKTA